MNKKDGPFMSELNQLISEQLQWFVFAFTVIMLVLVITVIAQGLSYVLCGVNMRP